MILDLPKNKKIILFDGVCNLCNTTVQYIIKHDKKDIFRFVSLQSALGKQITKYIGVDPQKTDSIILYEPGIAYYIKSEAALRIAQNLSGVFSIISLLVYPISFIMSSFLNDWFYDYIAKNRYKWYGKQETCMIRTPELSSKFL